MNDKKKYGSDHILALLKQHGIQYVACNPGASFRGLHDSIVNGDEEGGIQLLMCCHEEISVAIAHGYAKASGKFMAVFLHANIGLQHACMAIFNAWCDRVPMLIINGIGPLDTTKRRPWIEWIHTSLAPDSLIKDFVKYTDQPYSLLATAESIYRACRLTNTAPKAPVYVAIDSTIQEEQISDEIELHNAHKYLPAIPPTVCKSAIEKIAEELLSAKFPLIIADYAGDDASSVNCLIALSEMLSIPIIDCGGRFNFPNNHSLCLTGISADIYAKADMILALSVHDLYGALGKIEDGAYRSFINAKAKIYHVTLADYLVSKGVADYHKLMPVDLTISANSASFLMDLNLAIKEMSGKFQMDIITNRYEYCANLHKQLRQSWKNSAEQSKNETPIAVPSLLSEIWDVIKNENWVLTNGGGVENVKWVKKLWTFDRSESFIGDSAGAGLGYGLGASIGAALAYKNSETICIDLQADGDFLFTPSALWTASHYKIPLLIIMLNNASYNNSKGHALKIARERGRNEANAHIGTCFETPVNFSLLANSFGIAASKKIEKISDMKHEILKAIAYIKKEKKPYLIDVIIQ